MHIEELNEEQFEGEEVQPCGGDDGEGTIIVWDAKRALVGAGARALFYPTLFYNVVRNKIQTAFHWWDRVDEFVLLGAVPFPADVPRLKELGVCGVVTLNEPYETLVPTSLYKVKHKNMTPEVAYEHVRSIRPRVLLASSQWQAVQNYYSCMKENENDICKSENTSTRILCLPEKRVPSAFDDDSVVVVTESDLDGYDESHESGLASKKKLHNSKVACRFQFASKAAIGRLSCLWIRCRTSQEALKEKLGDSLTSSQVESIGVDIHVY